jgi:4-amino-4-deoxy-L-arabinose transferase-like glycosyltransferase
MVAVGRMLLTDPLLVLCLTGGLLTFWESLIGDRRWRLATAALLGLGILAKGPVAALLFLLIAGWTFWREPEMRSAFRGGWLAGIGIPVLIVASWYVPAYLINGRLFVDKFLIEQNVGRFTGGDAAHTLGPASLPFYIPVLFVGMLPWSVWIFRAWPRRRKPENEQVNPSDAETLKRYLATWAGVVFVFFSISGAKLPHYILPAVPPLAILVAMCIADRRWVFRLGLSMCSGLCVIANGAFIYWYGASGQAEAHELIRYIGRQGGDVSLYQLSRRKNSRGTGVAKIQETSLPSLLMYLNAHAIDTGKLTDILNHPGPLWIFTRVGRIGPEDYMAAREAGRRLVELKPPLNLEHFQLYRLE